MLSSSYEGTSLNDCLETSPSLNQDFLQVTILFRWWQVDLTVDMTEAFLQICIPKEDLDLHKFLYKCGDCVPTMRFVSVPFGNRSTRYICSMQS